VGRGPRGRPHRAAPGPAIAYLRAGREPSSGATPGGFGAQQPRWRQHEPLSTGRPMTTAGNPWLALADGGPSAARTRRLRAAHERLVTTCGLPIDAAVRSVVRDSWHRSLGSGVDPDGQAPPVELLDDELLAYRDAHPLAPVMPVIRRLLVEDAEADRMIVAVTDAGGRMLWVEGDSDCAAAPRACTSSRAPVGRGRGRYQRARHRAGGGPRRADLGVASTSAAPCSRGAARRRRCTTPRPARCWVPSTSAGGRPRGQPPDAHAGPGHRGRRGIRAALAARAAGPAAAGRRPSPPVPRSARGWRCSAATRPPAPTRRGPGALAAPLRAVAAARGGRRRG
jgi:hypothetical protein